MTWLSSLAAWGLHFVLTYTDAHSNLGRHSFTCDQQPLLCNIEIRTSFYQPKVDLAHNILMLFS